jgi:hypothetical protein
MIWRWRYLYKGPIDWSKGRLEGVKGSARETPTQTRVSETVQPTGQNKKDEDLEICHSMAYGRATCGGMEAEVIFPRGSAAMTANRAGFASGERFAERCTRRLASHSDLQKGR